MALSGMRALLLRLLDPVLLLHVRLVSGMLIRQLFLRHLVLLFLALHLLLLLMFQAQLLLLLPVLQAQPVPISIVTKTPWGSHVTVTHVTVT